MTTSASSLRQHGCRSIVLWLLGGADPALFAGDSSVPEIAAVVSAIPNHSPQFAPLPSPPLDVGVAALVAAAQAWLG